MYSITNMDSKILKIIIYIYTQKLAEECSQKFYSQSPKTVNNQEVLQYGKE